MSFYIGVEFGGVLAGGVVDVEAADGVNTADDLLGVVNRALVKFEVWEVDVTSDIYTCRHSPD